MAYTNADYYFLRGGGEMGELIRAKDWSKTSLGDPADWPQSLRTMVAVMLDNPFGMYIAWGNEYTQLYNDGYRPILGATKHPQALGISTRETFSEIWHIIESMFDGVMKGKAVRYPDLMLPLNRNGFVEDCYFDFAYSPIRKDNGEVGGVLVTVIETTEKKRATEALKESNARYINNIMQAPVAMCIFRGKNYVVEIANEQMLHLWGKQAGDVMHKPIFEGLPEAKDQGLEPLLENVYTTGEKFVANERPVNLPRHGKVETIYINFIYEALKEADGTISGIAAIANDVTAQVLARKSIEERDGRLRSLIENAPFPIGVYVGKEMRIEVANESIIKAWGKGSNVKGKLFSELMPELVSQQVFEQLDDVFNTGKPFHAFNQYITLMIDGQEQPYYYNYSFTPVFDSLGKVYGVMNTASDVTELNLAKKKIEESESYLKLMIHQAPVAISIFRGQDYTMEIANKHALELWGRSEEAVLGKPLFTAMPELLTQGIKELLDGVRTTGKRFAITERPIQLLRNGIMETVFINFSYEPLYDANEKINGIMAVAIDVTEQVAVRKKVEDSEKRYNLMLMQSPFAFLILKGKDMVVHLANESMKEVLGKGSDIEGKPLLEVLPELKGQAFPEMLDNVYTTGIPFSANEMLAKLTRNGILEDVYFNYVYQPYYEADYTIAGVTVIAYDVTASVMANKKIEASEQRLNIVVEASELGTYELNLKTKEPSYSKRYLEILGGYKEEIQLTHAQLLRHLHPDDLPIREKALRDALITGYLHYEARLIWNDNSIHWMEGKGKVFYDEENKPLTLIGTIQDITEEKNREEELKKSEEQFSTLADNMENLAWLADGEGWIYWYNKRWLAYTGLSLEEMQGWGWQKVHHPDHVERIVEITKKIWQVNETFELTFPLRRHDGEYRWFLTRGYPVTNNEGKIIRWIGTNTDITEQKKAEEQFKALADQTPMWVWLTDKEVNVLYANPEVLKFIGIAHYSEFTGNMWEQKVHPEDIGMVYQSFSEAVALQQSFSFEFRVLNASTQLYEWFYLKAVPRLESGECTGFIGTGININEQRLILSQLEYRKALLEAHNEASIDGNLLVDTRGKILSYNPRFVAIWNMPKEVLEDKDDETALTFALTQLVNPELFMERVRWMYEHPDEISIDELEFKDGKIIERYGYHVTGANGNYYGCSWMFRDITEQRKAERIIKESEEKFRLLADSMPQHIWTSDPEGNLNYFNQSVFDYSGLTLEQIHKDGWLQIVHPDDREENAKKWLHAISTGKSFLFEHRFRRYDGEYRWQLSRAIPQKDKNGNIQMWVGTSTDIQEHKTREEKKDEFISIASHEMKTPLTTTKAYLQMLELVLEENNEEAILYTKKASHSVNRLNELISELLDVSKIRLGKLSYTVTTFNFNEMIEGTVENIQLTSSTHSIIKAGEVNDLVTGDKDRLQQVVINLLTNAIKYSPGAAKVFVNVAQENDSITVSVKDTGIGIAQQSLDKIFDKYHRVEEHAVHFQGLGIGLFISYEIIQRHHGRLWAESEPGKGSTFYFTIPKNSNL